MRINTGGLGKAVSNAVSSGRHEITKPMRKTPSIGRDIEGLEGQEAQIPGNEFAPKMAFLDTLEECQEKRLYTLQSASGAVGMESLYQQCSFHNLED
jgi:hypothetical protein